MSEINPSIVAIGSALAGFVSKSVWDFFLKLRYDKKQAANKRKMDFLERQLSEFYWPLLIQLRKNSIVWDKLTQDNNETNETKKELFDNIRKNYFYPNNAEIMKIIESKYYLSLAPESLHAKIETFISHQAIFEGIKKNLNEYYDPYDFGAPYPKEFLNIVEERTLKLQKEYDESVGLIKNQ